MVENVTFVWPNFFFRFNKFNNQNQLEPPMLYKITGKLIVLNGCESEYLNENNCVCFRGEAFVVIHYYFV